jgi:chromosome segregation ATPase
MLRVEVACIEEKDHELSNLRAKAESFESEATRLRSGHDEACGNTKCLHGERTQLQQDLSEATSRAEEVESTLRVVNARLEEANSELRRELEVVGGRLPLF